MGKKRKKGLKPNHIAAWRKFRHLTQTQLAERVPITQGALSDLENAKFEWTQGTLEAIADALNCRPGDLVTRPPGLSDKLVDVLDTLSPETKKRALAVVQALKDSEAA